MTTATEPFWNFNKLIGGADASGYMLVKHRHRVIRLGGIRSGCPLCLERYAARERHLESIGYAGQVLALFEYLQGREIKYRQLPDGPWGFGRVDEFEYPNCCLDIQPVQWAGEECYRKSNWLRFGWCGILHDYSRFEVI